MTDLTDEQKREALLILSVGCDRETAARYVGCPLASLVDAAAGDAEFQANLHRAEAATELAHMRNVQQAAQDQKHWRASVWWLERYAPERYGPRAKRSSPHPRIGEFLQLVANAIAACVRDEGDRQRVTRAIDELAHGAVDQTAASEASPKQSDQDA